MGRAEVGSTGRNISNSQPFQLGPWIAHSTTKHLPSTHTRGPPVAQLQGSIGVLTAQTGPGVFCGQGPGDSFGTQGTQSLCPWLQQKQ
eukprot:6091619-Pyramimonas_sp.AAC.1